jgi:hypothetical protein
MIETREKEINGAIYSVTQLTARRAIRLKSKLIKLFGPVIAQVFVNVADVKNAELEKKDNLVKAVELLSEHLNDVELENIIVDILQSVRKNGVELVPAIIDLEFAGDIGTLYQVCWFAIEANFSSFFSLLGIGNQSTENPSPVVTKKIFGKK